MRSTLRMLYNFLTRQWSLEQSRENQTRISGKPMVSLEVYRNRSVKSNYMKTRRNWGNIE